jgi:AmmeMemoRadiSam system protein A
MVSPATLAALSRPGAAFVTLTEHGSLRGCIGSLAADQPLGEAVASAGTSAAVHDPRFMPLTEHELPLIHIDVSVLGPAIPLDDLMAFRPGVDGIIVARDGRRALFLPEVATDQGWGVQEVLDAVCEKAGLDRHAWQSSHTRLFVFRTICVSEPEAPATRCSP